MVNNWNLNKVHKIFKVTAIGILVASVLLLLFMFVKSNNEDVTIKYGDVYNDEGYWSVNGTEFMPDSTSFEIKGKKGVNIVMDGVVPNIVDDDWAVMILSDYCKVKIYVDNKEIFSYGENMPLSFGHMLGNIRMIAPIDSSMVGKRMLFVLTPTMNKSTHVFRPVFGYKNVIVGSIVKENFFRFMVCIIILVFIVVCFCIYSYQKINNMKDESSLVINCMNFAIFTLVWLLCSSDMPQFLTSSSTAVCMASFLALSAIAIPFNGMCQVLFSNGSKVFQILKIVGLALPVINLVGYVANLYDPVDVLILTHIYIAITVVASTFYCIQSVRLGEYSSVYMIVAMGSLVLATIIGFVLFYSNPNLGYDGIAYGIGFIAFFMIVIIMIMRRMFHKVSEDRFKETYRNMAYIDGVTKLENRLSFESRFSGMSKDTMDGVDVALVLFDIKDFHVINDNFGHEAGNLQLMRMANILREVFGLYGNCYRIGSDEMAVVMQDMKGQEIGLIKDFDSAISAYNEKNAYKLSVAYGYDVMKYSDDNDFYRNLYKNAYEKKSIMKSSIQ